MEKRLLEAIRRFATQSDSFYIYDEKGILEKLGSLKQDFSDAELLYSIKCNPHSQLLMMLAREGIGADAASLSEVQRARAAGFAAQDIFYSAPGKTAEDIAGAIGQAQIIVDSLGELARIEEEAARQDVTVKVGLRLHPIIGFDGEPSAPSKFGIDEDLALLALDDWSCDHVQVNGIHVHLMSQVLDADALAAYQQRVFELAERVEASGVTLDYINFGSGMGISGVDEPALDQAQLAAQFAKAAQAFKATHPTTRLLLESGRRIVGESGYYISRVVDMKESHGRKYVILARTLNAFPRPSMAALVMRYAADAAPQGCEPYFSGPAPCRILAPFNEGEPETVTIVGSLCTSADVVAENITLPALAPGDLVIFTNAGAYAAVLAPVQFSSQPLPQEFFLQNTR